MQKVAREFVVSGLLLFLVSACGGEGSAPAAESAEHSPPPVETSSPGTLDTTKGDLSKTQIGGGVTFKLDGADVSLTHIPADRAYYMSMASQVTFYAAEDSAEQLMLNIMNADLKSLDYPVTLPQPRDPNVPMTMANRGATVGLAYTDAEGQEWTTGAAEVFLESLDRNGVLKGRFDSTTLRNAGSGLPDKTLEAGEFSVQLTSPW